ncbi:MAG: hypothetical protein IJ841_10820 [Prevotella sp.]|nr:hypothetical protein [Prevotella sp.]
MKKKFSFLMAMLTMLSAAVCFTACSSDDDDDNSGGGSDAIEINGTSYRMSRIVTWEGSWKSGEGTFYVPVLKRVGNADDVLLYQFTFTSKAQPKVGDDFSKMSLTLMPLDENDDYDLIYDGDLPYKSGSAVVTSLDDSKNYTITVKFDHLTMGNDHVTYVFNGTTWLDYNFAR